MKGFTAFGAKFGRPFMSAFFKAFPQWSEYKTDKLSDVSKVIKEFHKVLKQEVVDFRYGVELPCKAGKLLVVSYKSERNYPAWKTSTPHLNYHTDGLKCKIYYTNYEHRYRVKDKFIWKFTAEAPFKKEVSQAFKKDHSKYIFSQDRQPGYQRIREMKNRDRRDAKIKKFLETYDEFEF